MTTAMTTRTGVLALTLALALLSGSCATPDPPKRPNIILILADDMGFSDLGCYGGEIATPNLDRLAARGLRFTQVYNTSKCFPSRACLLTGRYAQDVGMDRRPAKILDAATLGEALRAAGYRTLMTGKHHGTENPFHRGFDRYFGLRDGGCNYFNPGKQRPNEPKPAQKRNNRAWCIDGETFQPYTPKDRDFYTTDAFTDYALKYLEEYEGESKSKPFFLYIAYNAPHDPLHAWPEDIAKYDGRYDSGWEAIRAARYARQTAMGLFCDNAPLSKPDFGDWSKLGDKAREEETRRMEVYAAMVDRLDQNIGRVLRKVESMGELENTLIIFASDNGGSAEVVRIGAGEIGSMTRWASLKRNWANVSNTPFRRYKNHSHEGGICTPFIVHWPKGISRPGAFVRAPAHFIDVMATFVDIGRAAAPKRPLPGVSLAPLFRDAALRRDRPIFFQWRRGRAVRDGRWKLVTHGGQWELYDLSSDRTEQTDLAAKHPERVASTSRAWATWFAATPAAQKR